MFLRGRILLFSIERRGLKKDTSLEDPSGYQTTLGPDYYLLEARRQFIASLELQCKQTD
jgi:hypothetical protein